jgi:hypothetical protein
MAKNSRGSIPNGECLFEPATKFATDGPFGPVLSNKGSGTQDAKSRKKKRSEK